MAVKSFLMIPNRKIPVVGKASYGRDFLDNRRLTLRNIQVYCLLQVLSQNNLTKMLSAFAGYFCVIDFFILKFFIEP